MLKPTKESCDFCIKRAHARTFAGDNMCKGHAQSWSDAMTEPRRPGQPFAPLWGEWVARQRASISHIQGHVP